MVCSPYDILVLRSVPHKLDLTEGALGIAIGYTRVWEIAAIRGNLNERGGGTWDCID